MIVINNLEILEGILGESLAFTITCKSVLFILNCLFPNWFLTSFNREKFTLHKPDIYIF